jgi:hypothetical protein
MFFCTGPEAQKGQNGQNVEHYALRLTKLFEVRKLRLKCGFLGQPMLHTGQ